MPTEKLQLPTISGNQTNDVETHFNALANAVDNKAGAANGLATLGADGKVPGSQLNVDLSPIQQEIAAHQADYVKHTGYAVATGSANTYIATLNPALSAYAEGVSLRLKVNVANTGASTVNVNGLGAKAIKKSNGNAVASGNIKAGSVYTLAYDGTSFILQGEGGEYGTAGADDVLAGVTLGTEDGVVSGTLALTGNAIDSNVLSGRTYYNTDAKTKRTGTMIAGKRWATGEATSASNGLLTVTGLSFMPRAVVLKAKTYTSTTYQTVGTYVAASTIGTTNGGNTDVYVTTGNTLMVSPFTIQANGFSRTVEGNILYRWIAYE